MSNIIDWTYDDGGRAAAGYRGITGDCAVRALAIVTDLPYDDIYARVNAAAKSERSSKRRRGRSSARTGVYRPTFAKIAHDLGLVWVPTMGIGTGCRVHLRAEELPAGRIIAAVSKHWVAVIDGIVHDTHDCTRKGTRCVYGYWRF
jgi:hypothetical protein